MDKARKREFKNELFEQFARIGKALSTGRRLELIDLLAQGERTVEELALETDMSVANASRHLQTLRQAQLVVSRRSGNHIHYRLTDQGVLRLWLSLRELCEERLAEVKRLVDEVVAGRTALEAVGMPDLRRRLKDGTVLVLDVRPDAEYRAGHIAGARSIPVQELRKRLKELPNAKTVVAYCRGPYCVFADEAVALLRAKGYRALRLEGGFPEWRVQGGAVAHDRAY
jgi:rhodanese-related sulfurtransferase/DNA-binding transcriptional ArsR family regulator